MNDIGRTEYQALCRRTEFAWPAMLGVLLMYAVVTGICAMFLSIDEELRVIVVEFVLVMIALPVILLLTFRVHRWTIARDGVHIEERPKLRFAGRAREAVVAYADIAALHRLESAMDQLLEIVTRSGRSYRLMQAKSRTYQPDLDVYAFADAIRAGARRAGYLIPVPSEGLSFWNRSVGLACLVGMFLAALAISGALAWVMIDSWLLGLDVNLKAGFIVVLLPPAAGYFLRRALLRQRAVLGDREGR